MKRKRDVIKKMSSQVNLFEFRYGLVLMRANLLLFCVFTLNSQTV